MYTKKFIMESLTMSQLDKTNYSNLKYDNDATKTDSVNKALLDDINAAAKSAGLVATITTARSGHNKNVKGSKRVSRHMNGTGVDVAILNGIGSGRATNSSNGNAEFRNLGNKLKNALVSMGYTWNVESGNDKAVLWQTNTGGNHYNHLHISNRTDKSSEIASDTKPDEDDQPVTDEKDDQKDGTTTDGLPTALAQLKAFTDLLRGIKPPSKDEESDENQEDNTEDETEDNDEEDDSDSSKAPVVNIKDYKITEPSNDDKDFYTKVLDGIDAPLSKQNYLYLYAWRQAEGAKSTFNPFNTTQKKEGSTFWNCLKRKNGGCVGGVRNYTSKQDGIDATVKTLTNGHYKCIVDGLKSDKGATQIAKCSDLKTWGTGDLVSKVLSKKTVNPPEIAKTKVKSVNESFDQEKQRIEEIIKKVL